MRALRRVAVVLAMSIALLVATAPTVAASTSRFTVTLTIRGHLAPDIGFDFTPFPSVGGLPFCVASANAFDIDDPSLPMCRSGRTYTSGLTVGRGESVDYEITLYHPTWARALFSGTLTWDGRNHRRDYVIDFDLPATDTVAPALSPPSPSATGLPSAALPIIAAAWLAGWVAWSATAHRRRSPSEAERPVSFPRWVGWWSHSTGRVRRARAASGRPRPRWSATASSIRASCTGP